MNEGWTNGPRIEASCSWGPNRLIESCDTRDGGPKFRTWGDAPALDILAPISLWVKFQVCSGWVIKPSACMDTSLDT